MPDPNSTPVPMPSPGALHGHYRRGRGEAAAFTRLDWVERQTRTHFGIDPFPGTLNIELAHAQSLAAWRALRGRTGFAIAPPAGSGYCSARGYPMSIAGLPAAAIVPDVPGYGEATVELVAAINMRDHLALEFDAALSVAHRDPFRVRAVMFDVDGTLLDSVPAYFEIARLAAEPLGSAVTLEEVRDSLASGRSFWQNVIPQSVSDRDARMKEMSARARREWPRVLREQARPFAGLHAELERLCQRGLKLGIVTAAQGEVVDVLREAGLARYFSAIVTGSDVARRKPDPEGLVKCLELLDARADETLYVGDTPLDVHASRAAGTFSLGVLTGAADSAMLTRCCADRLLPDLGTLASVIEV